MNTACQNISSVRVNSPLIMVVYVGVPRHSLSSQNVRKCLLVMCVHNARPFNTHVPNISNHRDCRHTWFVINAHVGQLPPAPYRILKRNTIHLYRRLLLVWSVHPHGSQLPCRKPLLMSPPHLRARSRLSDSRHNTVTHILHSVGSQAERVNRHSNRSNRIYSVGRKLGSRRESSSRCT